MDHSKDHRKHIKTEKMKSSNLTKLFISLVLGFILNNDLIAQQFSGVDQNPHDIVYYRPGASATSRGIWRYRAIASSSSIRTQVTSSSVLSTRTDPLPAAHNRQYGRPRFSFRYAHMCRYAPMSTM